MQRCQRFISCALWAIVLFCLRLVLGQNAASNADAKDPEVFFQFVTRPDIGAPKWEIEVHDQEALAPGYWFVAPYASLIQTTYPLWNGPHIYDQQGGLIWSGAPMFEHKNVHDFRVQMVNDVPMLTLNYPHDFSFGEAIIMDKSYEIFKSIDSVGNNSGPNMHDFLLKDNGKTALMLTMESAEETQVELPSFSGVCKVRYQGFKEIDVETGNTIYEWNDKGRIGLEESTFVPTTGETFGEACAKDWDITHFNSVDKFKDGSYLISSRHTDTLYKISPKDDSIVWRLGGVKSDFEFKDDRAKFSRQHHVRIRAENETHTEITVFDNAIGTGKDEVGTSPSSWGLHLALRTDTTPMTAELVSRYEHPHWKGEEGALISQSRGSVEVLPNGNTFLCWVWQSLQSEHAHDGRLLKKAYLKQKGTASYRTYKFPWVGKPAQPPDVHSAARKRNPNESDLTTVVHVSWNGATEVATWNLLHSNFNGEVTELIASSPRQGFETRLEFDGFAKHVILVGLDVNGQELGRSKVKMTRLPPDLQNLQVAGEEMQWVENAKNSSLSWQPEGVSSPLSNFGYFTLGVVFCIGAMCLVVVLILRRRAILKQRGTFWWLSRQPKYSAMSGSEDETEQHEWMLNKEGRYD